MYPVKPYSEEDYRKARYAEQYLSCFFTKLEVRARRTEFDTDIQLWKNGQLVALVDVEVKHSWRSHEWPQHWQTAHFTLRKFKYANGKPHFQVVFNEHYDNAYVGFTPEIVKAHVTIIGSTIFEKDAFYDMPLSQVGFGLEGIEPFITEKLKHIHRNHTTFHHDIPTGQLFCIEDGLPKEAHSYVGGSE